jgi:hypothetical protein
MHPFGHRFRCLDREAVAVVGLRVFARLLEALEMVRGLLADRHDL